MGKKAVELSSRRHDGRESNFEGRKGERYAVRSNELEPPTKVQHRLLKQKAQLG